MFRSERSLLQLLNQRHLLRKGNTVLHLYLKKYFRSVDIFEYDLKQLIERLGRDEVCKMTTTLNDKRQIPLEIADDYLQYKDYEGVEKILLVLMDEFSMNAIPNIHGPVETYPGPHDALPDIRSRLEFNLQQATLAANAARKLISTSGTYPHLNTLSVDTQHSITQKIINFRIKNFNLVKYEDASDQQKIALIREFSDAIILHGIGNCTEFSVVAWHLFLTVNPQIRSELFSLKKGDHIFLVIDRDPNSDENNVYTWGPHAVICDVWTGRIYPAYDYSEKMLAGKDHIEKDHKIHNLLTPLHSLFHYPKLYLSAINADSVSHRPIP